MEKNHPIKKSFSALTEEGLRQVRKKLIKEEKEKNGYLIIAGKDGKVKKVPAKEL